MTVEDREATRANYDEFGDAEWNRLVGDVAGRVSLEVYKRFLARFVRPGARVLEVGEGPGRFTTEDAALARCRLGPCGRTVRGQLVPDGDLGGDGGTV
ncbi:hypothetical protein [Actinotalea sp. JY-7885]|uniref:hypothetical protein n=1 Tax=Actinotalea sp. JY-7885 TaxID=2758576 RepID=UPI00165D8FF3|nr:hypothetical protein [Actinotalea sp. JY-7885]